VWNNTKNVRKWNQKEFYKVIAASVFMYGSENCGLNRSERRNIQTAGMCFSRHVSGYTSADHMRSNTIQAMCYKYELYKKESKTTETSGVIAS
jgi:hypothetical protein